MAIATIGDVAADVVPGLIGISAVLVAVAAVLSLALHIRQDDHGDAGGRVAVVCLAVVVLLLLGRLITAGLLPPGVDGLAATNVPLIAAAALSILAAGVALRTRTRI